MFERGTFVLREFELDKSNPVVLNSKQENDFLYKKHND